MKLNTLAERAGLAQTTIRNYRDRFADFFPQKVAKNQREYSERHLLIMLKIKECYAHSLTKDEIERILYKDFGSNEPLREMRLSVINNLLPDDEKIRIFNNLLEHELRENKPISILGSIRELINQGLKSK